MDTIPQNVFHRKILKKNMRKTVPNTTITQYLEFLQKEKTLPFKNKENPFPQKKKPKPFRNRICF